VTGSGCGIRHISDCIHDSNEIPTAIFVFGVILPSSATSDTDRPKWVTKMATS